FRDGRRLYFGEDGNLVAWMSNRATVVYRRDNAGRIRAMEALHAGRLQTEIRLDYDSRGLLKQARAGDGRSVEYTYDGAGMLTRVDRPAESVEYRYQDGLLTDVTRNGRHARQFEYADRGRL